VHVNAGIRAALGIWYDPRGDATDDGRRVVSNNVCPDQPGELLRRAEHVQEACAQKQIVLPATIVFSGQEWPLTDATIAVGAEEICDSHQYAIMERELRLAAAAKIVGDIQANGGA
jgi:hypothetical protein